MDLSHNLQLQGLAPLAGRQAGVQCMGEEPYASTLSAQRANALSQMNLRAMPNSGFERSPSFRDLAQPVQSSASCQLSAPAMLVGTVAALQEESGQLRTQWKADVSRLERELDQLRSAAAWALPHLAEAQRQQEIRTDRNNKALMLQNAGLDRSTHLITTAPPPTAEALMMHSAALDRSAQFSTMAAPKPSAEALLLPESGSIQAQEQAARQITEALLAQMRATAAECSLVGLSRQNANERACPESLTEASLDCSYRSVPFGATFGHSAVSPGNGGTPQPLQESPVHGVALEEMHKELERMEIALQQVIEENGKLREEKRAVEEAHNRDVASLEAMLNQIMEENKRLTEALAASRAGGDNQVNKLDFSDRIMNLKQQVPMTPSSVRSEVEPAFEPEIERSAEFDRRILSGLGAHLYR